MAVHPVAEIVPGTVAVVVVIPLAAPAVTVGAVFTPLPETATLIEVAPPPPTDIFPL